MWDVRAAAFLAVFNALAASLIGCSLLSRMSRSSMVSSPSTIPGSSSGAFGYFSTQVHLHFEHQKRFLPVPAEQTWLPLPVQPLTS